MKGNDHRYWQLCDRPLSPAERAYLERGTNLRMASLSRSLSPTPQWPFRYPGARSEVVAGGAEEAGNQDADGIAAVAQGER